MTVADRLSDQGTKRRVMYGGMVIAGIVFVSTIALPVSPPVAQLVAALSFGVMAGLWLGQLVYSI